MAFDNERLEKLKAWLTDRSNLNAAAEAFGIEVDSRDMDEFGAELCAKIEESLGNPNHVHMSLATRLAEEAGILPVFGMPTTQRSLYYLSSRQQQKEAMESWGEVQAISRDQETAIYEYQPGSTRTVDKSIYKVGRLVPAVRGWKKGNRGEAIPNFDDDSKNFVGAWSHWRCLTCGVTNVAGSECQLCGSIIDDATKFEAISPMAYATEGDLPSERQRQSSLGVVGAREIWIDGQSVAKALSTAGRSPHFIPSATVWAINDNRGQLFKMKPATAPWRGLEFDPELPQGQGRQIALTASKVTDVLAFWPDLDEPDRYRASNVSVDVQKRFRALSLEAAIYSAQFIIRRIVSFQLDIDPEEIQIAKPNLGSSERPYFQGRFADALPNGSGICQWLGENWGDVLSAALDPGHKWVASNPMAATLHSKAHAGECGSACPKCILEPRNHSFHFALDWRLGREALRLLRGTPADLNAFASDSGDWGEMGAVAMGVLRGFWTGASAADAGAIDLDGRRYRLAHPLLPVEKHRALFVKEGDPADTLFVDAWGALRNPSALKKGSV